MIKPRVKSKSSGSGESGAGRGRIVREEFLNADRSIFDGLSREDLGRAIDLIQIIADGRPHPEYEARSPSVRGVEEGE